MQFLFWACVTLVIYTYVGYGFILFLIVKIRGSKISPAIYQIPNDYPSITHIIAAFNEEEYIEEKIENSLALDYQKEKNIIWVVTDGSNDSTPELVKKYKQVRLFHQTERRGKIHAVNRVMKLVETPITIYSDANTVLNHDSLKKITRHYQDLQVGCVSGEKRIRQEEADKASSAGEGIYWKYESFLKKYDYRLYSVVGAAGELFSIRTSLFKQILEDTLIEDFYLSLSIAQKGYKIAYEPEAYAMENSSDSIREESKRKIRIAAGGHQAISRLRSLLNIFKYGWLSFQYISHRVLRWTITPIALLAMFVLNILLYDLNALYQSLMWAQFTFYVLAFIGYIFQQRQIKVKVLFVPFYFAFMNLSVFLGFFRFIRGNQSVLWERAARKK